MHRYFKVPVTPYVKKYWEKKLFAGLPGPYKLEEDTLPGKMIMTLLIDHRPIDFIDRHLEQTEVLELELSFPMARLSPTTGKLVPLNYFVDKMFKSDLIAWIQSASFYGVRPFPAAKTFLEFYNLDESEYTHDAAYRHWQRFKNVDFNKNSERARTKKSKPTSIAIARPKYTS